LTSEGNPMTKSHPVEWSEAERSDLIREINSRIFDGASGAHHELKGKELSGAEIVATPRNVLGVGVGEKITNSMRTGQTAIVVFVHTKAPAKNVGVFRAPASIGGFPTDVIEIGGDFHSLTSGGGVNPAERQPRPFPAGVSIGTPIAGPGTLGYRVTRPDVVYEMILSNYHVLADLDDPAAHPPIFQPGFGSSKPAQQDQIGVYRAGVPIEFDSNLTNVMDAAVAIVEPGMCVPAIRDLGPITATEDPKGGELVRIYGHSTGYSAGTIGYQFTNVVVYYGPRPARFEDQLMIQRDSQSGPIADNGDSGALVVKSPSTACGLLFASYGQDWAIATPIGRVLRRFRMTLVTP